MGGWARLRPLQDADCTQSTSSRPVLQGLADPPPAPRPADPAPCRPRRQHGTQSRGGGCDAVPSPRNVALMVGDRLLPSPSLMTSLSSWGLEGHRAEIHRCFSLLGRGRLNCPNMRTAVSRGHGGETRAERTGYDVQTWDLSQAISTPRPTQASAHPALRMSTEQVQDPPDASSASSSLRLPS